MATRTLSLARLTRAQAPVPLPSFFVAKQTTSTAIQCRRTLTSGAILPSPWSPPSTQLKSGRSLGLTPTTSSLARGKATPAGLVTFRPYHVTLRTLDHQNRPPGSNNIDDHQHSSTSTTSPAAAGSIDDDIQPQQKNPIPPNTDPKARMLIGFTCTVCNHRSHKTMSKHAYQHGVVIMQCDHCKNRHLIADHLGWFKNGGVTVEDLVKERGEEVRKLTKSYQLVKDGEMLSGPGSVSVADNEDAGAASEAVTGGTVEGGKEKTELEKALEKASEGMLEWIPKEILEQEEERMKKSQEAVNHTKKV
ncbi:Threonine synthase-like 1 [Linnemannia exigua]|uniref:Threonine synthase-like 1 n=1 Tax=Linnemannia exigua TaxID=604196 RepID=A0AAD4DER5_9FUNG|nr:Threonine synthase-like 1 [Linnemannia exigua]